MNLQHYFEDISFFPFRKEFHGYSLSSLHKDMTAGISVALLTLPQAMAYALVAGLPLSTGLFAAIFSSLIASIFGSSRHLVNGPSNALAIMIQYGTAEILHHHFRDLGGIDREIAAFQIMVQMTVLVAILQLLAASFKLGRLTQFVSYSVVLGYVMGASAAIVIGQLFVFSGVPQMPGIHSLIERGMYFITHVHQTHWMTLSIGLGSLILLIGLKRWSRKIPAALITFAVVTSVLFFCKMFWGGEFRHVLVVGDTGEISSLIPKISLPFFDFGIMNNLLPMAFAVALLSILETISVGKSIAAHTGQRLSINQEILALGLGNLTSSFVGALPISGSASRSSVNYHSGAQTRLAGIFGAVMVGLILYIFEDFVTRIPLASLSALLLITAGNLVKKRQLLLCLKSTRSDAFVFWITFLSCLFFGIDVAFFIGVSLSITLYLKKAAIPQVLQYFVDEGGRLKSLEFCTEDEHTKIRFIKVKGELFFGAADLFQTTLKSIAEVDTNTKVIILQLKNARDIDATACLALQQLHEYLVNSGRYLMISGITLPVWEVMSESGLVRQIGKENLFVIDDRFPTLYFQRALKRATELAQEEEVPVEEFEAVEEKEEQSPPEESSALSPVTG